jgi:hypothetical protein
LTLLLHLPFDEGAGTLAADTSGNNRTGTLAGGATWMTGKAGSAVLFNRTTSQVTVPDFPLTSAFSVSFWFKPTEIAGDTYQYLFSWGPPPSAGANALNVWICGVGVTDFPGWLRTTVQDTNDGYAETLDVNTSSYILDGNWHFYCLTVSKSAGCQVYVDGQFRIGDPNRGGDSIDPNSAVFIGARSDGNVDRHYGGGIDDVRIYGQALAASDVQALYVGLPANAAPTANAGANQKVMIPNALTLAGTVSDDGQPTPPAVCTAAWSLVSGPGTVTFANPAAASTTATFATAGTYVLMLTASDSALTATSTVTVTALAPGDFNGDGRVDGVDFLIWQSHYPRSSGGTPDGGDANGDGQVDGVDFLVWQSHYQG